MAIFILIFTILHMMSHIIPSGIMAYHMWHMKKFHGASKWKLVWAVVMIAICILTMIELPDMLHSLSHQCQS